MEREAPEHRSDHAVERPQVATARRRVRELLKPDVVARLGGGHLAALDVEQPAE